MSKLLRRFEGQTSLDEATKKGDAPNPGAIIPANDPSKDRTQGTSPENPPGPTPGDTHETPPGNAPSASDGPAATIPPGPLPTAPEPLEAPLGTSRDTSPAISLDGSPEGSKDRRITRTSDGSRVRGNARTNAGSKGVLVIAERTQLSKLSLDIESDIRDRLDRAIRELPRGAGRRIVERGIEKVLDEMGIE